MGQVFHVLVLDLDHPRHQKPTTRLREENSRGQKTDMEVVYSIASGGVIGILVLAGCGYFYFERCKNPKPPSSHHLAFGVQRSKTKRCATQTAPS